MLKDKMNRNKWIILGLFVLCAFLDMGTYLYATNAYPDLTNLEINSLVRAGVPPAIFILIYIVLHGAIVYKIIHAPKSNSWISNLVAVIAFCCVLHLFGTAANLFSYNSYKSGDPATVEAAKQPMPAAELKQISLILLIVALFFSVYTSTVLWMQEVFLQEKYKFPKEKSFSIIGFIKGLWEKFKKWNREPIDTF